ncbi:PAS domain-containing serine/threonine-protein kinase-like [Gigantopelta aegis]|uniref:PAS domain-containing serine/threonine-protein kinase-like n=1 Tax=Gigantopelta aegis TaxID=1735272 RepID=UPI001B88AF9F|nr:PAS domain-containing serine/threonine-protein kinase-like [Gigantopelta aegis]
MADELKGCVMMSTPKAKYSAARRSLPDDTRPWSPDHVENIHPWSSPVICQKSNVYSTTCDIRRTLLEGKMEGRLAFGSPSYPSPLDRVRSHRKDRALQMGLPSYAEESFELNQSYPKVSKPKLNQQELSAPKISIGDGLNDFSFSPGLCKGSFSTAGDSLSGQSLNESWSFYNYVGGGQSGVAFPTTVRNPNKAICTINAKTSEILIANDMACELFGYDQSDLVGMKLKDLIHLKPRDQKTLAESHLEPTGEVVSLSGIVVDAIDSNDLVLPVSLWVKKLDYQAETRCLCVMEPVDRSVGTVVFDKKGSVLSCDQRMASLHGYPSPDEIRGLSMRHLIPTFKQPSSQSFSKDVKKQQATGKTKSGALFPLSIMVSLADESKDMRNIPPDTESILKSHEPDEVFVGMIWVFANISGMITFLPDGTIHNVNENFSRMLFGFNKDELVGKDISTLIPDFYDILDLEDDDMPLPPLGDEIVTTNVNGDELLDDHHGVLKELQELNLDSPEVTSTPRSRVSSHSRFDDKKQPVPQQLIEDQTKDPITECRVSENSIPSENSECRVSVINILSENSECENSSQALCTQANNERFFERLSREIDADKEDSNADSSQDSVLDQSNVSTGTDELFMSSIKLEDSSSQKSCTDSDDVNSGQDGINADISSDDSTSDARTLAADLTDKNRKQKTSVDFHKQVMHNNLVNCVETSSDSGEGSFACFGEKATNLLPLFSNNNHSFAIHSTSDPLIHDESSYFSRDELDSYPCADSSSSGNTSRPCHADKSCYSSDSAYANDVQSGGDGADSNVTESGVRPSGTQTSHTQPQQSHKFPGGSFSGFCRHRDGQRLPIIFQVKPVELEDGSIMYCMWISRDPEEPGEGGRSFANLTLASSLNSTLDKSSVSLGELLADKANSESKLEEPEEPRPTPCVVDAADDPGKGEYNENYMTLDSIGKGAFGFVKLGRRKSDCEEVVVKFIRRAKVLSLCWVDHDEYGKIPLEVGLLLALSHPNIVRVLDVYQNTDFIQMVMEKHGSGMDLFEFIDRGPLLDEALCSYMFRQMVSAVVYLHSKNIVHRDIKDENIIVSEKFNIKLIDFGAATYLKPGKLFATFCGTIEYCSPEVLLGNKYKGPELEVWSMGVTLYTLVFGENPFFDIEETIQGTLNPPFKVSRSLMFLISWLLHPDPVCRATVRDAERNAWVNQPIHISLYKWSQVLPNCEFHGNTASDNRKDTSHTPVDSFTSSKTDDSPIDMVNLQKFKNVLSLDDSSDYY